MSININNNKFCSDNFNYNNLSNISKFYYCVDIINKMKGLSIIHMNIQSLVQKMDHIRIFYAVYKPDILCLTESWLSYFD